MTRLCALAIVGLVASCRTEIVPVVRQTTGPEYRTKVKDGCNVNDYSAARDVPDGAQNLGWLQVPRAETDEQTFVKLREAVCAKGGNALSQARWIREAGQSIAEAPVALEANAWNVP